MPRLAKRTPSPAVSRTPLRPADGAGATPPVAPSSAPSSAPSATAPVDPPSRVLRQFRQVFNTVKTHFQQVERQAGLGGAQVWALSVIRDHPGLGVNELARRLDVHQSTASNLVRGLVEAGLVAADRAGTDRRAVQLQVRPGAAQVLRQAPGPYAGVLPEALAQLDPATLARLEADLATLLGLLKADRKAARKPLAQM